MEARKRSPKGPEVVQRGSKGLKLPLRKGQEQQQEEETQGAGSHGVTTLESRSASGGKERGKWRLNHGGGESEKDAGTVAANRALTKQRMAARVPQ